MVLMWHTEAQPLHPCYQTSVLSEEDEGELRRAG
jgi:hypothetical protein